MHSIHRMKLCTSKKKRQIIPGLGSTTAYKIARPFLYTNNYTISHSHPNLSGYRRCKTHHSIQIKLTCIWDIIRATITSRHKYRYAWNKCCPCIKICFTAITPRAHRFCAKQLLSSLVVYSCKWKTQCKVQRSMQKDEKPSYTSQINLHVCI